MHDIIDVFHLMFLTTMVMIPFVLVLQRPKRAAAISEEEAIMIE